MINISHGTLGITRQEGLVDLDPLLVKNAEGYYGLSEGSPAIDSAKSGYPPLPDYPDLGIDYEVLLDLMKQIRPDSISEKDIGCSEFPQDSLIRPHVDELNTGLKAGVYLLELKSSILNPIVIRLYKI